MSAKQVKERPILMSAPMVRAILDGRKTQTRRIVKKPGCQCGTWIPKEMDATTPEGWQTVGHSGRWWCECCTSEQDSIRCPYGQPGDRLWVKETWNTTERYQSRKPTEMHPADVRIFYRADYSEEAAKVCSPWRPSLFMRRWMSRITLEIVSVRVERLQEISHNDALAEGVEYDVSKEDGAPVPRYRKLWESINGEGSWAKNPWCWVVEFRTLSPVRRVTGGVE